MAQLTDSELLALVFGAETHNLRAACAAWMAASRPFRAFFEENASKIRKKARLAGGESLGDVALEMRAAYHLLSDRRVSLAYERYLADKTRGPDFTVTYKGHVVFNVEVRRLRPPVAAGKLGEVICEKLRQMPPSAVNVLLIGVDDAVGDLDCAATIKRLVHLAESKQERYFTDRGYRDAREFLRALARLSAVMLLVGWQDATPGKARLWINAQARFPLPPDAQRLLLR
jgi:hypothetical protein